MAEALAEPVAEESAGGSPRLPTPDHLFLFLEGLRQDGYHIDPAQIAAAERLLLDAHAAGPESEAARRLKFRLVPLIAKTADEQEDVYRQFHRWRGPSITGFGPPPSPKPPGPASEVARRDPRRRIIAAAVAAAIGLGAATTWYLWPPPVSRVSPPEPTAPPKPTTPGKAYDLPPERFKANEEVVSPFYAGAKAALTAAPMLAFLGLLILRWRRRAVWMSRGIAVLDGELATVPLPVNLSQVLFAGPEFRAGAQDLRKHRYRPTRQLNVRKTVEATAAGAGLFCPVYRERPQLPEYVFLIEQNGSNDHLVRLFDLAVERLQAEDVFIQRYYFHTDPRHVQADDAERTPVPLADLLARAHDHRLFVIATAGGFFHPLTGEVEGWVRRLEPWRSRTMLSTQPLEQWTVAELQLLEEGFSLATAEASGFAAAGEKIAVGTDEPELLEGVVTTPVPLRGPSAARRQLAGSIPDFAVFRDVDAPWCPEMVVIPSGEFLMGSPENEKERLDDEGPQHWVTIGHRFALGRYPVTFDEYDQFCEATGWEKPTDEGWGRGKRPVINVSWLDAIGYCEWLAKETGRPYRLLSEAEWEYACRAGTTTRYAWGDAIMPKEANYSESTLGKTTEVGVYLPNAWGLYDMHGNVWEWVEDVWHDSYEGAPADGSAWTGGEGKESSRYRVDRGGSLSSYPWILRSAFRYGYLPELRLYDLGFRVARTID